MPSYSNRFVIRLLLVIGAFYFTIPLWWFVVSATKTSSDLFGSPPLWFAGTFSLFDNISQVFTHEDGVYLRWIRNSLLYSGVGALLATLLSAGAGYVIAKFRFAGRTTILTVILASTLLPASLLVLPLYLVFSSVGLINTVWSVIIPTLVSPFGVFLSMISARESVPDELLDAARIDGAGELRIFFTIALRIMSPALVTVYLFTFVGAWNNFFLPLVTLNSKDLWPVVLGLSYWNSNPSALNYHLVITGALLSTLPLVIAFVALQRFWRSNLTLGAVKF